MARLFPRRWRATDLRPPHVTALIAGRSDPAESPLSRRGRELAGQELGPAVTLFPPEDGRAGRAHGIRHLPHRAGFPLTPDGPWVFGRRQQGSHGEPVRGAVPSGVEVEGELVPWSDPPGDGLRAGAPFPDAAAIPLAAAPECEYEPSQPTTSCSHLPPPPAGGGRPPFRRIRVSWTRRTIRDAPVPREGLPDLGRPLATGRRRAAPPARVRPVQRKKSRRKRTRPLSSR